MCSIYQRVNNIFINIFIYSALQSPQSKKTKENEKESNKETLKEKERISRYSVISGRFTSSSSIFNAEQGSGRFTSSSIFNAEQG